MDHVLELVARHAGCSWQLAYRDDYGRLADDSVLTVDVFSEFRQCEQAVAGVRLRDGLLGVLLKPFAF